MPTASGLSVGRTLSFTVGGGARAKTRSRAYSAGAVQRDGIREKMSSSSRVRAAPGRSGGDVWEAWELWVVGG